MRRALTCMIAAIAVASASAGGLAAAADDRDPLDVPLVADLDGDGAAESVRIHETSCFDHDGAHKPPCARDVLRTFFVEVTDTCARGALTLRLSREMEFMSTGEVIDADGDGQARELAFEARAGATARGVQSKVVRFRADAGGCIAVQKTLFSYPRAETIGKRPRGTFFRTGYLGIGDFDRSRPGLELRTEETYSRATDPGCCPSWQRVTYWRFAAVTSRYRPYRTQLSRVPRP